jgi:hypothetical protein
MFVNQLNSKNLKTKPTLFLESLFAIFQDQRETPLLSGNFKTRPPWLSGKRIYYGQGKGRGFFFFFPFKSFVLVRDFILYFEMGFHTFVSSYITIPKITHPLPLSL